MLLRSRLAPPKLDYRATGIALFFDQNEIDRAPIDDLLASEGGEKIGTARHAGFVALRQEMAVLHGHL